MPEGEEKEQELENLFEIIMKENFPNLATEIDFQEVQEAQRVPKKLDPRKHTPRQSIITLSKIKDKERIFFKKIHFIYYAITVVPFYRLYSAPPCTPPPTHIPPL